MRRVLVWAIPTALAVIALALTIAAALGAAAKRGDQALHLTPDDLAFIRTIDTLSTTALTPPPGSVEWCEQIPTRDEAA